MRPTILVVDDDAATRKMINTALTESGFDVVDAGTASEAVSAINREDPDVVLLDLILPDGDGVQVTARSGAEVSIIMVTAKRPHRRLAGRRQADDYVTKPLSIGERWRGSSPPPTQAHARQEEPGRSDGRASPPARSTTRLRRRARRRTPAT